MDKNEGSDSHKLTRKDKDKYTDIGSQTDIRFQAKQTNLSETEKENIQQEMMKQLENIVNQCEHEKDGGHGKEQANSKQSG